MHINTVRHALSAIFTGALWVGVITGAQAQTADPRTGVAPDLSQPGNHATPLLQGPAQASPTQSADLAQQLQQELTRSQRELAENYQRMQSIDKAKADKFKACSSKCDEQLHTYVPPGPGKPQLTKLQHGQLMQSYQMCKKKCLTP